MSRMDIREGMQLLYCKWCPHDCKGLTKEEKLGCLASGGFVDDAFPQLHSQGVVKKVDRELLKLSQDEFEEWCGSHNIKGCGKTRTMCEDYCRPLAIIEKAGYVAVEPLIGE